MTPGNTNPTQITPTADFLASRARAANDRARLAQTRVDLGEDERELLSADLSATFLALGAASRSGNPDPQRVAALVARGARPAAFEDYELTDGGNYGTVFRDWVEGSATRGPAGQEQATWRALEAIARASDLFVTNRAYVGNGGMPAVYWALQRLGQSAADEPNGAAGHARLLEALKCFCSYAPETSRFWRDLTWSAAWDLFQALSKGRTPPNEDQRRAAEFILRLILNPPSEAIYQNVMEDVRKAHPEDRYASSAALAETLAEALASPHMGFLLPILFGPSRWRPNELWSWFFSSSSTGVFFRSPATRRALTELITKSRPFRTGLLGQSELVFSLVENCERTTLDALLRRDAPAMLQLRNPRGDTLLHAASRVRAPVHRVIRALLSAGFDPNQSNVEGETAITIAEHHGRRKTLTALRAQEA